ncbi:MAG: TolC family protein [Myxococcales bacterium]
MIARAGAGGPLVQGLEGQHAAYRQAEQHVDALVDNPTLSVMPGVRAQPDSDRGFELQASLTQSIRTRDVSAARRHWARTAARSTMARTAQRKLEHVQRAAELWFALWQAGQRQRLLERARELAVQLVGHTRTAVARGVLTRPDLAMATAFESELRLQALGVEGELHDLGLSLAALLSDPLPVPRVAQGEPPRIELPALAELRDAADRLGQPPTVRAADDDVALARSRGSLTRAEIAPRIGVGVQLQRESPNAFVALLSTSFQLPVWDQSTLERAQADAQLQVALAAQRRARLQAAHDLARLVHEVEHQRRAEQTVRDELLPALSDHQDAMEQLFALGECTVLQLLRARQAALDGQQRLLDARVARLQAEQALSLWLASLGAAS